MNYYLLIPSAGIDSNSYLVLEFPAVWLACSSDSTSLFLPGHGHLVGTHTITHFNLKPDSRICFLWTW